MDELTSHAQRSRNLCPSFGQEGKSQVGNLHPQAADRCESSSPGKPVWPFLPSLKTPGTQCGQPWPLALEGGAQVAELPSPAAATFPRAVLANALPPTGGLQNSPALKLPARSESWPFCLIRDISSPTR